MIEPNCAYAHTPNAAGRWHLLEDHLRAVAEQARTFAAAFGAGELGYYTGLWHDIGKLAPAFQQYLLSCAQGDGRARRGPDHKAAGALLAGKHAPALALLIQGHHGGLRSRTDLKEWLQRSTTAPEVQEVLRLAARQLKGLEPFHRLLVPPHLDTDPLAAELFLRMLFSALVDADFQDTEAHFQGGMPDARRVTSVRLEELWQRLERSQQQLMAGCSGPVAQARREIYEYCLAAAESPPGLFRLTVPTGGGKTRSGMGFALRHALRHGMQRIIVAVPFISITEQTAEVYREIFEAGDDGTPVVLEHHSAFMLQEEDEFSPRAQWTRLAAENWDAPIIVTTAVQLFESLFGNSPAATRKLHRLARSVIILDEAQTLPSHLLSPILDVLGRLCTDYGSSVVLSTATQPAFEAIAAFSRVAATEIVPQPQRYFAAMKRVRYEWLTGSALSWDEVAALIKDEPQALVVLNTKADALAMLDALGDPAALHLSTFLCGAHRRQVIREVKRRLAAGEPCRLVSTQVIEAGVDLDFPLVLRALGPLDSIIQAGGRCNREGRLPVGRVIVFRPQDGGFPPGVYRVAAAITARIQAEGNPDPDDPAFAYRYFQLFYKSIDSDREQIQRWRQELNYPKVAELFRMIEDDTEVVVVRYGPPQTVRRVEEAITRLRQGSGDARQLIRALQPYFVAVRRREAAHYARLGLISSIIPGVGDWLGGYDPVRGLSAEEMDLSTLVV